MTQQSKKIQNEKLHYAPTKKGTIKMTPKLKALAVQNFQQEITGANTSAGVTFKSSVFNKIKSWL